MAKVFRADRGSALAPPVKLSTGFIRYDAFLARTGCLVYYRADGSPRVEYRPPEAHTDAGVANTCELAPLTIDHPAEGCVTPEIAARVAVGSVGRPTVDGDRLKAALLVTSARGIAAVKDGYQEVSLGYACELDETPGVAPDGTRYDAVQRGIEINHVALVRAGRAGPSVRLRADSMDVEIGINPETPGGGPTMAKRNINGVEVEVPDTVGLHLDKLQSELSGFQAKAEADKSKAEAGLRARCDAAEAQVESLKKELAEAPARIAAAAKTRADLEVVAKRAEVKCDGLGDGAVRAAVAAKVTGVNVEGKSPEYVAALYDVAVAQLGKAATQPPSAPIAMVRTDAGEDPLESARQSYALASERFHLRGE